METKYKPPRFRNAQKGEFLRCLGGSGLIQRACEAAGIHRQTYYDWRRRDHRFAEAANTARNWYVASLEADVDRRAIRAVRQRLFNDPPTPLGFGDAKDTIRWLAK